MERRIKKCVHLVLKRQWYDMIQSGEKKEEYRDFSDYYFSRLMAPEHIFRMLDISAVVASSKTVREVDITNLTNGFDTIAFHRGYTGVVMYYYVKKVTFGYGRPEWGAPTDRPVFKIYLDGQKYV